MSVKSKILTAAGVLALTAGAFTAAFTAGSASATTLTCTDTQGVTTVAGATYGCGGLTFNGDGGAFSLADTVNAAGGSYDSAPIVLQPSGEISPRLDFTVFTVCNSGDDTQWHGKGHGDSYNIAECTPQSTVPYPSGSAPLLETLSGPGALGIYVAVITPDGRFPDFTVLDLPTPSASTTAPAFNVSSPYYSGTCDQAPGGTYTNAIPCPGETFEPGPETYCISVAEFTGPNGKDRWWALDRQCDTNGEFTYGTAVTPGTVDWSSANKWQEWAPTVGASGLLMDNISLDNKYNSEYDLNVSEADYAPGTQLQAYQDNKGGVANDLTTYTACTPPGTLLSVFGTYGLC